MKRLLLLLFSISSGWALAQTPDKELEYEIESIAEGNEENETDLIQIAENLQILLNNPIEVNFATEEELSRLPYLNIFQINNLLQYRARSGLLYTPYELTAIKGFERETIERILPYLSFNTQTSVPDIKLKNVWLYSRHDILARSTVDLQKRDGYLLDGDNGYLGSPADYYLRYKGTYKDIFSLGITTQQDAGEPFGGPYQDLGVDFMSGHFAVSNYGKLRSLIIGDYQAEFGQGMAFWTSLAFGKSAEAVEIKRYARGFRAFSGVEENRFLRGAATTYRLGSFDLSAFYSNNKIDANVSDLDSNSQPAFVSSLQTTGLHRTLNELDDKDANRLQTYGANINYKGKQLSIGLTTVNYQLQTALKAGTQPYQSFNFSGSDLTNVSIDFNYLFKDINFFGELASSDNNALAGIVGFQSNPSDQIYFTLLYRQIATDYQALFNAPFGESGRYGERGTYIGLQWQFNSVFQLKSYFDIYQFDWLRFGLNSPSRGRDLLAQLDMYFSRYLNAYVRIKNEIQEVNSNSEDPIPTLTDRERTSLRIHTSYSLGRQVRLASRYEMSFYDVNGENERGSVLFQDIRYYLKKVPITLTARFALTDTRSFNTRIYAYENDLTYAFSIPPYYGRSNRFYLLVDWDLSQRIVFQAKYAVTKFLDRDQISSGLNLIDGNVQSELKLQLRVKF